jgi:hypothetical protein
VGADSHAINRRRRASKSVRIYRGEKREEKRKKKERKEIKSRRNKQTL